MRQPSTTTLLIKNGILVTPQGIIEADLLAQGEHIKAIGRGLPAAHDTHVLDASGCYVLSGVIDSHTHIQLNTGIYRTPDDWFAGTRAAACGGVTTVIDFATQFAGQSLREAVEARLEEAQKAVIDYGFHVMVTDLPPGREGELAELIELGTPSVKLYTTYRIKEKRSGSYRPNYYADDATILRLMETCADLGLLPLVHCENDALVTAQTEALVAAGETGWRYHGRSRPALAEQEAIQRVLFLAEAAGCPVHICHCSTARSVALVAEARDEGQRATCETCPQYLLLDDTLYEGPEPWRYILQPPLRDPWNPASLWMLVENETVDSIVTDHCDYTEAQKTAQDDFTQTPGGLPGLETLLPLMYTYGVVKGELTLPRLAMLLSTNPARLWGLWPRKGALLPGAEADIVVYDPAPESVVNIENPHHLAGYTPYEGMKVQGRVEATISRGQIIYREGQFTGQKGRGRFVERKRVDE
ncbi:MAG: dihydropyrimidinase [Anaerolineaceae bacterium 4572_32.2]|nr:MAG: dihydropyrimidinase [Anaerolineaceae bacterium 4572_32.2]HEY73375.1 dihydropyrimidinase [Thermoflexia bacterium]